MLYSLLSLLFHSLFYSYSIVFVNRHKLLLSTSYPGYVGKHLRLQTVFFFIYVLISLFCRKQKFNAKKNKTKQSDFVTLLDHVAL